jgi:hypothetical protein
VETGKNAGKPSEEGKASSPKTQRIDFNFESLVGAAIADVVLRRSTKKRKGNWKAGPKR